MISEKANNILNSFPDKYEVFEKNKELGFEALLDDSKRLYEIIKKEHNNIKFIIRDGMWHTYQLWFNDLPESELAISELVKSI